MSIDLILQGTKADIATLLRNRGLTDAANTPITGFEACWWAGEGKFMTVKPVYSGQTLVTPAVYLAGFVLLARIHGQRFVSDKIAATGEQWVRSAIAKWIKDNGVLGSLGGIGCYTAANVRLFRAADVIAWCATNNIPSHEWAGGNSL